MKKVYKKPTLGLFPTKCHISTLSPNEPEEMDKSRRSLLTRFGLLATVGHVTLYGASGTQQDAGPGSVSRRVW